MKVLVLSTVFPNPAQPVHGLFVFERLRHAAGRCDIRVVAPVPWFRRAVRARIPLVESRGGLSIAHPTFFYTPGLLKWLDGFFLFLSVVRTIGRLRTTFDFDLIDVHFGFPEGVAGVLLGWWFTRPVTITLRGTEIDFMAFKSRAWMMRWALRRADAVIAVSHELAGLARTLGVPADRIDVIENGVDTDRFAPRDRHLARRQLGLPDSGRLLVSVGHLVPRKGFHRALRAVTTLAAEFPDLTVAIVGGPTAGSGRYARQLRALVDELALGDRVLLVGAKPADSVALWLAAADIFVLASDREGCPNVVWEALACGRPVVATRVGEVEHMVPSCGGLLVERGDDASLGHSLARALRTEWDHAAIRAHAEGHSWDRVADRVAQGWQQTWRHWSASHEQTVRRTASTS